MSYDKLKKLGGANGSYKYENPYIKPRKEPVKNPTKQENDAKMDAAAASERPILDQNSYILSQIYELKRNIEDVKFDIVSLLMLIEAKEKGLDVLPKISVKAMREKYFGSRASYSHVLRNIVDKTEAIVNNDLNFNDHRTTDSEG